MTPFSLKRRVPVDSRSLCAQCAHVPRHGDETFYELAQRTTVPDFSGDSDGALVARAAERVAERLTIAVEVGMIFAELMGRGWTAYSLHQATDLHRRSVARWAGPFLPGAEVDPPSAGGWDDESTTAAPGSPIAS
jgi:hypothetical protein